MSEEMGDGEVIVDGVVGAEAERSRGKVSATGAPATSACVPAIDFFNPLLDFFFCGTREVVLGGCLIADVSFLTSHEWSLSPFDT